MKCLKFQRKITLLLPNSLNTKLKTNFINPRITSTTTIIIIILYRHRVVNLCLISREVFIVFRIKFRTVG